MNRIQNIFDNKKLFIPFITAGYPSDKTFVEIVKMFDRIGAGIVEIGIPFSDPLADGKTIQGSSQKMLDAGITVDKILDLVRQIRQDCSVPIMFMTYYNLVLHRGIEKFISDAKDVGVDGMIIPDLPPEDADDVLQAAGTDFAITFLCSTITPIDRRNFIVDKSTGFIYFVSRLGVTGQGLQAIDVLEQQIIETKNQTEKPIAVGFGVSGKEDAEKIYEFADGVIVGSAIIDFINKNIEDPELVDKLAEYCEGFVNV